jgi:hypothetical protein
MIYSSIKAILDRLNAFEEEDKEQNALDKAKQLEEFRKRNPDRWPSSHSKD